MAMARIVLAGTTLLGSRGSLASAQGMSAVIATHLPAMLPTPLLYRAMSTSKSCATGNRWVYLLTTHVE